VREKGLFHHPLKLKLVTERFEFLTLNPAEEKSGGTAGNKIGLIKTYSFFKCGLKCNYRLYI